MYHRSVRWVVYEGSYQTTEALSATHQSRLYYSEALPDTYQCCLYYSGRRMYCLNYCFYSVREDICHTKVILFSIDTQIIDSLIIFIFKYFGRLNIGFSCYQRLSSQEPVMSVCPHVFVQYLTSTEYSEAATVTLVTP